jgi:hypothetical protein
MGDEQPVTFTEVWNAAKDLASIMQNGESRHFPSPAFAVPKGQTAADLDWADEAETTNSYTLTWGSPASELGLSSGTSLRIGVTWRYGGRLKGRGRFLHEARLWAVLDYSGLGQNFDVQGSFGDPYLRGETGVLVGTISVQQTYMRLHWADIDFDVEITGTGGGYLRKR